MSKEDIEKYREKYIIECEDGWMDLLKPIFDYLEKRPYFTISQIKEKYGTLRVYTYGEDETLSRLVENAENESAHVCEFCGSREKIGRTSGYIQTLCEKCAKQKESDVGHSLGWHLLNEIENDKL